MKVEKVVLENFRNYTKQEITFLDGLNVICGLNASGKTNLMESIFVAAIGRSPRTKNEKEMIKMGEDRAYIHLNLEKKFRSHQINVEIDKAEGKKIILLSCGVPVEEKLFPNVDLLIMSKGGLAGISSLFSH